ncbi:ThiF family adenylyltransferase [Paenibacillus sp. GCM10028914]|uniref:ThiF family adenylyltransferase n=1 Tax=Paenibacillus sp. GCM10028914 TaxID=3273416 RepID=UPI00361C9F14
MNDDRYSRQEIFKPIGSQGQQLLSEAHVLIIGAGALGSGNAEILARSGVGTITIVDRDVVEWSNLQRQSLYSEEDVNEQLPKAIAAANRLKEINSGIRVNPLVLDCTALDLQNILENNKVDLIIDATDHFSIRYIINDISFRYGIPWIYGACSGSFGAVYNMIPGQTPCLHCLLKRLPVSSASCDREGIIAPTVQMVVSMQSAEALKFLSGNQSSMSNRYIVFDLWSNMFQSIQVNNELRSSACPTCGNQPTYPYLKHDAQIKTEVLCGRTSVWLRYPRQAPLHLEEIARHAREKGTTVKMNSYLIQIEEPNNRLVIFQDGRALVHGTSDPVTAKKLYQHYIS